MWEESTEEKWEERVLKETKARENSDIYIISIIIALVFEGK